MPGSGGRATLAVAFGLTAFAACRATPAPLGEALVVVETDVAVPARVNRLRIDVLAEDLTVLSSREVPTPSRADWPVSFSVVGADEEARAAFIRLRAYPEGHVVATADATSTPDGGDDARVAQTSLEAACRDAPELHLEQPLTLRRGASPITTVLPYTTRDGTIVCSRETRSGSAVARFVVAEEDTYVVEVVRASPDGARGEPGGDTTLSLRRDCLYPTAQVACADDISVDNRLSRLAVFLTPGTYFVVTGGAEPAAADLTLLASRPSTAQRVPDPVPRPPPRGPRGSEREPSPGVTIDRLVAIALPAAARGTVSVVLHGECFGSPVDLGTRSSCIDTAGATSAVIPEPLAPGLRRATPPPAPWSGDDAVPCTATPRPASALLDEEVCIPGGAFLLGDNLALTDGELRSQPERMRVVEPFLLDRHEVTVGRYRDALRRGFRSVVAPDVEAGLIRAGHACTWNVSAEPGFAPAPGIDRERHPLSCVPWAEARAFCNFIGGDLPTEDQWEYAATAAGRPAETSYPWGRDIPTCDRAVYGRSLSSPPDVCAPAFGPVPVDAPGFAAGDRTPAGVVGLAGNVQEWLLDGFAPYADRAWRRAGLRRPLPFEENAPLRVTRGGDWAGPPLFTTGSVRRAQPALGVFDNVGFRCARRGR